jgi:hypothetical protein
MAPRRPPAKPRGKIAAKSSPKSRRTAVAPPRDDAEDPDSDIGGLPTTTSADLARLAASAEEDEGDDHVRLAIQRRVKRCLELLDLGLSYSRVMERIQEEFNVVQRTAERDLARSYEAIAKEEGDELPQRAARVSRGLWRIAHKAEQGQDWKAATSAFKQLSSIYGMDAPKKVQLSGGISPEQKALLDALQLTPTERLKRIGELSGEVTATEDDQIEADGPFNEVDQQEDRDA